jgi:hypothetical protein
LSGNVSNHRYQPLWKEQNGTVLIMDLLWKPIGRKVRFVLVKTGEKMMILMCSDFTLYPEQIILAYSYQFKIEVSFKMLKHVIGSFGYHFWTKRYRSYHVAIRKLIFPL